MERAVWRLFLLSVALSAATPSWGQSVLGPEDHCTEGDLQPNIHAWYTHLANVDKPDESTWPCQLRSFFEPDEGYCFCEHDVIWSGTMWSEGKSGTGWYGWTPREFVRALDMITTPDPVSAAYAQAYETPVRSFSDWACIEDDDGNCTGTYFHEELVQKQSGLAFRGLPIGNYWVFFDLDHPVEQIEGFNFAPTVTNFRVLPHAGAHDAGRPEWGTVFCPPETDCADGIDNDGDGFADCDDNYCNGDDACHEQDGECFDDADNDGDGAADCDDLECYFGLGCFFPFDVPGIVQAENFNLGGEGFGYSDADPWNNGEDYRDEGVDVVTANDGITRVGWTVNGEWLAYDIDVMPGTYHLTAWLSSGCGPGCPDPKVVQASIEGEPIATFTFDTSGGWEHFIPVAGLASDGSADIVLAGGVQELRLEIVSAGLDLDYVEFVKVQ